MTIPICIRERLVLSSQVIAKGVSACITTYEIHGTTNSRISFRFTFICCTQFEFDAKSWLSVGKSSRIN